MFRRSLSNLVAKAAPRSDRVAKLREKMANAPRVLSNTVIEEPNELEKKLSPEIEEAHRAAFTAGESMYTDPTSGLMVFTRQAHIDRGRCCGSKCRHCPYAHANVPTSKLEGASARAVRSPKGGPRKADVYTRTGDKGTSSLFTGERSSKHNPIFDALGTVDELNSNLGMIRSCIADAQKRGQKVTPTVRDIGDFLHVVQERLIVVGSIIATPSSGKLTGNATIDDATPEEWVTEMEAKIDALNSGLPGLTAFIRPGGNLIAAHTHVARSVCRRAERTVVFVRENDPDRIGPNFNGAAKFVNRLSDYLFIAARTAAALDEDWEEY